jgi:hypothetical protein
MLRKISIALVASAASLLLSGGMASADECDPYDTECGTPFVNFTPLSPEQLAPVGATGMEREGYDPFYTECGDPFVNFTPLYPEQAPVGATGMEEPEVNICPSIPEQEFRD